MAGKCRVSRWAATPRGDVEDSGVAIPAPDGATMVRTSTFIHGHRIELVGLHGKQGRLPGFPASLGDYGNMHVQVTPQIQTSESNDGYSRTTKAGPSPAVAGGTVRNGAPLK